ncbi:MAG: hypothetical protein QW096_09835 [Thermofilaceae archaeon]
MSRKSSIVAQGFTPRVRLLALLLITLLSLANVYIALAGGAFGILNTYALLLLFVYVSRLLGEELTTQEIFVLFQALANIGILFNAYPIIYRAYLRIGEVTNVFKIAGKSVAELIPTWLAPPAGSSVFRVRTLFHPDILTPLLIPLIFSVLWFIAEIIMILITSYLFVEIETLPYPFAPIDASYIQIISEKPIDMLRIFLPTLLISFAASLMIYLPAMAPTPIFLTFYDFTLQITEFLPGGVLAFQIFPSLLFMGLMIPFPIAATCFIVSLIIWTFLNSLFVTNPVLRNLFPEWAKEYRKGMTYAIIVERSTIRIWAPIQLGAQLGMALFLIIRYRREIARALSSLARSRISERAATEYPSLRILLTMYFVSTLAATLLYWLLLPELPLYLVALFILGLGILLPIANAYMVGTAGPTLAIPSYTWHFIVYSQIGKIPPSTQISALLQSLPIIGNLTGSGSQAIKVAKILGAKPMDYIKALAFAYAIGTFANILILDLLWRIAPIPSMIYPNTVAMRDQSAYDCVILSGGLALKTEIVLPSIGLFLLLFTAFETIARIFHFSIPIAGIILGLTYAPAATTTVFLSSLIGHIILPRILGKERMKTWFEYRGTIVAAAFLGDGIAVTIFTLLGLISRASWTWPW